MQLLLRLTVGCVQHLLEVMCLIYRTDVHVSLMNWLGCVDPEFVACQRCSVAHFYLGIC